jgi:hypothetical protein
VILLTSTFVLAIVLALFRGLGLRESNLRGWPAPIAAGVVMALGDRALNGPFEDWPASYLQFALLFRGRANSLLGSWGALHPLNRLWALGFPVLCALLLIRRSPLRAEPS